MSALYHNQRKIHCTPILQPWAKITFIPGHFTCPLPETIAPLYSLPKLQASLDLAFRQKTSF